MSGLDWTPDEPRLEDDLAKEEVPDVKEEPVALPAERACFPITATGMPKALSSIPAKERPWFWRNQRYRGHFIAYVPVQDPRHEYLFEQKENRAFYVKSPQGTIGLVPFPNSTIVWPWELAWSQDLAPENKGKARQDFKPERKK